MRGRTVRWIPAAAWALVIFTLSSIPTIPSPDVTGLDKVAHFVVFAVLGAACAFAMTPPGGRIELRFAIAAALLATAYGVTDEIHQSYVPGRFSSALDLLADALGSATGAAAWAWYAASASRRSR